MRKMQNGLRSMRKMLFDLVKVVDIGKKVNQSVFSMKAVGYGLLMQHGKWTRR